MTPYTNPRIPAQHQHSGKIVDMIRQVMVVSDCSHGFMRFISLFNESFILI